MRRLTVRALGVVGACALALGAAPALAAPARATPADAPPPDAPPTDQAGVIQAGVFAHSENGERSCGVALGARAEDGRVVAGIVFVMVDKHGDPSLIVGARITTPDRRQTLPLTGVMMADEAGDNTADHDDAQDGADDQGFRLATFRLGSTSRRILGGMGRDGKFAMLLAEPGGHTTRLELDLTTGLGEDDPEALSHTPAGNPAAFAGCLAGLGSQT